MKLYRGNRAGKNILETYDRLLDAWNVEVEPVDILTRYGTTHVNVFGKEGATPVVLFHGVGDDSALMWVYNAAALAPYFRLFAIDTIGGPGRSIPNQNYNKHFEDEIWIDETLNGLGLGSVNIIGVSHGGYLAQYYALKRPERVNKIACLASSVPAGSSGNTMKIMMKIFLPEALIPTKRNVARLLVKLSGKNSAAFIDNPLVLEHFTYLLRGYNNMAMGYHKITGFTDVQIADIKDKALYVVGEADPFAILGGKAALEKYNMNARFFADVGHGINHEIAGEINSLLIEYLG